MKKVILTAIGVLASASADAANVSIPTKDVAEALQSLVASEKSRYEKLVVSRVKTHGCKLGDSAALKGDKKLIPDVQTFQTIVAANFSALDGGKYAGRLDPSFGSSPGVISAEQAADILHAYAGSSRASYTAAVVARAMASKCSSVSEQWAEEKGLPLPAQFTRAVAEGLRKDGKFSYSLQSKWPVNKQNTAKTDFEKKALEVVSATPKPFYAVEELGGKKYFSAAYSDVATNEACSSCHNEHKESPRHDFKVGDIMGDLVVRIPLK